MSFSRWFAALSVVVGVFTLTGTLLPVVAQDSKDDVLSPDMFKAFNYTAPEKGKEEASFIQKIKTVTIQKMTVEKQEVTQKQDQTFYIQWIPQASTGTDKKVKQKIIGVKMDITIGSNKIAYDSVDEKAASPMADFFNALTKTDMTFVLDTAGKQGITVKEVTGREDFIKKLTDAAPQMKNLLSNILSDDAMKQMAQPCWGAFPGEKKKKGETWESPVTKLNLGAIGSYDTKFTYTYEGGDKISIKPTMTYKAPTDKESKDLPFKITGGNLASSKDSSGWATFDRKEGRIKSSHMEINLTGTLKIDVSGTETSVALDQKQVSDMETLDPSNPEVQKMLTPKK